MRFKRNMSVVKEVKEKSRHEEPKKKKYMYVKDLPIVCFLLLLCLLINLKDGINILLGNKYNIIQSPVGLNTNIVLLLRTTVETGSI